MCIYRLDIGGCEIGYPIRLMDYMKIENYVRELR